MRYCTQLTLSQLSCLLAASLALSQEAEPAPASDAPNSAPLEHIELDLAPDVSMTLVKVPAGSFQMGSEPATQLRVPDDREMPRHEVTISHDFYIGVCETTRKQFAAFVEATGYVTEAEREGWDYAWDGYKWDKVDGASWRDVGFEQADEHPAICVTFDDAVAFCRWATEKTGHNVLLPTEAQWEYAARAGCDGAYPWGDAWEDGAGWANAADEAARREFRGWRTFPWDDGYVFTSPVGTYKANAFGLHDISGNVWEWTVDWYDKDYYKESPTADPVGPLSGTQRVVRGGSCISSPPRCRVAGRLPCDLRGGYCDAIIGFRVVVEVIVEKDAARELPAPSPQNRPDWPDFRGPRRDGTSPHVPTELPDELEVLWNVTTTGPGYSGIAIAEGRVILADKSADEKNDIWRCLDAETGESLWTLEYEAEGPMDYTNSPRATPVIHDGKAYLLGAFGHLHCVDVESGSVIWNKQIIDDFGAERPIWGMTSTPLLAGGKLVVNPGAEDASVAALDPKTGETIWTTSGKKAAYASMIAENIRGHRQVIGYDAESLGGWDLDTGERLWTIVPEREGDFNVPTPQLLGDQLLVATENNSTRLYEFKGWSNYRNFDIVDQPVARFDDLAPDMITPIVHDGMIFCPHNATLYCLDAKTLELLWEERDMAFYEYASLIAGNGHVLLLTIDGELLLIRADRTKYDLIARRRLFDDAKTEIWSYPAITENKLFIRNERSIRCLLLE